MVNIIKMNVKEIKVIAEENQDIFSSTEDLYLSLLSDKLESIGLSLKEKLLLKDKIYPLIKNGSLFVHYLIDIDKKKAICFLPDGINYITITF